MSDFDRNKLEERRLADFKPVARPVLPEQNLEEEDEEAEETPSYFDKFRLVMPVIILAIICFISYAWYTDKFAISRDSKVDLPVVKASLQPLREKPDDPGGMKIINLDKRVYDAISGKDNSKDKKAENLLPAPEEPISHDEIAKITNAKPSSSPELINKLPDENAATDAAKTISPDKIAPAAGKNNSDLENVTIASRPEPGTNATTAPSKAEQASQVMAANETAKPIKIEGKAPATEKTVKEVTAADIIDVASKKKVTTEIKKNPQSHNGYRVQLGSYRSEGDAEISWKNIKKKFSKSIILDGLSNYIEKADLGEKGIYYRLQVSGIKNEADARKICQTLTEKKQECFFVGK